MLCEEKIVEFQEKGFVDLGRVMSDEQADVMRERLYQVIEGKTPLPETLSMNYNPNRVFIQVANVWEKDDLFKAHLYNPLLCEMVADAIGTDTLRVWHDQVLYKPPKVGGPTFWHQDFPNCLILQPADLVTAWVALNDADVENGCMWMVPGSHKWGAFDFGTIGTDPNDLSPVIDRSLLPVGADVTPVAVPVKKGHCELHHCLTWHSAMPNHSDRDRPAAVIHFMPGYTRYEKHPTKTHLVEHKRRVEVQPGEVFKGKHFPTVWEDGKSVAR